MCELAFTWGLCLGPGSAVDYGGWSAGTDSGYWSPEDAWDPGPPPPWQPSMRGRTAGPDAETGVLGEAPFLQALLPRRLPVSRRQSQAGPPSSWTSVAEVP